LPNSEDDNPNQPSTSSSSGTPSYGVPPRADAPFPQAGGADQSASGVWSAVAGCFLAFFLVVLQIPLFFITPYAIPFIGLTQIFYIMPLVALARRKGKKDLATGLIIGAAVLFMLSASCLGLMLVGLIANGRP
jgi:hypothetical protein